MITTDLVISDARSALCIMQWYIRREGELYTLPQRMLSLQTVSRWRIQKTIPVNTNNTYLGGSKMALIHQGWTTFCVSTRLIANHYSSVYSHGVDWALVGLHHMLDPARARDRRPPSNSRSPERSPTSPSVSSRPSRHSCASD